MTLGVIVSVVALMAAASIVMRSLPYRIALRWVYGCVAVCLATGVLAAFALIPTGLSQVATIACCIVATIVAVVSRIAAERRWLTDARDPLDLDAPFAGKWIVVAGGPNPARNHHLIASDQRFAYDFVRVDELSEGTPILAPIAGRIVSASDGAPDHPRSRRPIEDPHPLGNHVAIETPRGCVFLCHLQNGSVAVREGDLVEAGALVGRCGNSGRTTRPHLHIHAQNLPTYAFNRAEGIPIAFSGRILRADDSCP